MIAAVINGRTIRQDLGLLEKPGNCDIHEIRLDFLEKIDEINEMNVNKLLNASKKPVIITIRKESDGGHFRGSETKRISLLRKCLDLQPGYMDVEFSSDKKEIMELIGGKKRTKIIISYHNFENTPNDIGKIHDEIKKIDPDIIKIVTKANSVSDNFRIFDLVKKSNQEGCRIIAFCMGDFGQFSRIQSLILGSQITYASASDEKPSAPSQISLKDLNEIYNVKTINKDTKVAGLIGNPVGHSWSHILHNLAFKELGINAVYLKYKVDKIEEFVEYCRKQYPLGFSVTIPHKIEIMKHLDETDDKAKKSGLSTR